MYYDVISGIYDYVENIADKSKINEILFAINISVF